MVDAGSNCCTSSSRSVRRHATSSTGTPRRPRDRGLEPASALFGILHFATRNVGIGSLVMLGVFGNRSPRSAGSMAREP